jgi:hypothetical protein
VKEAVLPLALPTNRTTFFHQRLVDVAAPLAELLLSPDPLHLTKLMVNRGMPDGLLLVIWPTVEYLMPIRQVFLEIGVSPNTINKARKLHDQNAYDIAFGPFCHRAVEKERPQALVYVMPIVLSLRAYLDVAPREQPENWHTLNFAFAYLQLLMRSDSAAAKLARDDANRKGNHGGFRQSEENYEKVLSSAAILSLAITDLRGGYLGGFSTQCIEHIFGAWATAAHGDLSMANLERVIGLALARHAFMRELGLDVGKPGRISERRSGAILEPVESIDFGRVWPIAIGFEAAFEVIEFAMVDSRVQRVVRSNAMRRDRDSKLFEIGHPGSAMSTHVGNIVVCLAEL